MFDILSVVEREVLNIEYERNKDWVPQARREEFQGVLLLSVSCPAPYGVAPFGAPQSRTERFWDGAGLALNRIVQG